MIIEISTSGGFGGLAVAGLHKRIDVTQQSASMQREICEYFEPQDLERLSSGQGNTRARDMLVYQITVTDVQDGEHTFTLREDQLPPEMLDLLDSF